MVVETANGGNAGGAGTAGGTPRHIRRLQAGHAHCTVLAFRHFEALSSQARSAANTGHAMITLLTTVAYAFKVGKPGLIEP